MKKKLVSVLLCVAMVASMAVGCGSKSDSKSKESDSDGKTTLTFWCHENEPWVKSYKAMAEKFEKENPDIKLSFTFDSSGKLQTQIEEGADADVFFSAAMKQMNALEDEGLVDADSVVELLENKIALIVPKDSTLGITGFEDITKAEKIALGDPESVPVGQYSKEAFENLGMWDDVEAKTSFGTNVTEVLSWVAAGSADAGIVYLTDATTSDQFDQVKVIGYAPEGSVSKVIYPVGVVSASTKKDAAQKFVDYLGTDDALSFFAEYGFTANK